MLMICPNAKECKVNCISHKEPHEPFWECDITSKVCPACIEVEEPQGQLVMLPPRETLPKPIYYNRGGCDDTALSSGYRDGREAVYSSAKPVDIEALAEKIYEEFTLSNSIEFVEFNGEYEQKTYSKVKSIIKQAIEDYIGRV